MKRETLLPRILYLGAALVLAVMVLLPVIMILFLIFDKTGTTTPGPAITGIIVVSVLHFLIFYAFREAIIVNKRAGHLNIAVYIVSIIGLLLLGLVISDGAFEFLNYYKYYLVASLFFLCILFDLIAAGIFFIAVFLQAKKSDRKKNG